MLSSCSSSKGEFSKTAYCIIELDIHDPELMAAYAKEVGPMTKRYGGRYLARTAVEPLEGGWEPSRIVIVEFPDMETLKNYFASPEYAPLKAMRHAAANSRSIALEGLDPPPRE
jgi:uncharacterized protein (DUF1330 family)